MAQSVGSEIGKLGQYRFGGWFYEEFLHELRGRKGVEVYREMSENDDIVGAVLFAMEMLMRQVQWNVKESGSAEADIRASEFVFSCMHDMTEPWLDFISEVMSFLTYGWSYHEIVYKRRMGTGRKQGSRYGDGLIGWEKLPIRSQDTLWEWKYGDNDELTGMIQMAPPDFAQVMIPMEKSLLFKTKGRKGNPEGRSLLRNAYRSWYFKRRIQEIEGIGIERDLAGLPVLQAPEGSDIFAPGSEDELARALGIVRDVRRDSREGVVLPPGWEFKLMSTGGNRQFDTNAIIERYDNRIAMTVLADFITIGHQSVGSFAMAANKTRMFGIALGAFLDIICETFNSQAIRRLIDMNGRAFDGITDYPKLVHSDVEPKDLEKLGAYIRNMAAAGLVTPDPGLESFVRMAADMPEADPNVSYMGSLEDRPGFEPEVTPGGEKQEEARP